MKKLNKSNRSFKAGVMFFGVQVAVLVAWGILALLGHKYSIVIAFIPLIAILVLSAIFAALFFIVVIFAILRDVIDGKLGE